MGGRWINRHDNWLKKKKTQEQKDQIPVDDCDYGVTFIPLRCPRCKSKNVRCYVSRPPIRYHICRKCGKKFKSVEASV